MFSGGRRFPERELQETFERYQWVFPIFLDCIDREKGDYRHLPAPGSLFDQPHWLMSVFHVLRNVFIDEIRKEWERKTQKAKGRR